MTKAPHPTKILKFQGRRDWPLSPGVDDWGLTSEQQESYVEQFRLILEAKKAWIKEEHDYFELRRFLRARSYDLERATTMWMNHIAWEDEFSVKTILHDFHFEERNEFVAAYPQGYHKLDKEGRPIYIQQLGKIDIVKLKKACSEERMIQFHIQEYERCRKVILPICSRLAGHHIDQTFGIMDVSGVGLGHLTGEIRRLMTIITKYDQDNYPEMLGHICIINAPSVFRMMWNMVKNLIDPRTQSKIEILGTDYKKGVLKWVDVDNLPIWLGGKSEGHLIDDVGPWSDPELCAKIGVDVEALRAGKTLPPILHLGTAQSRRYAAMAASGSAHLRLPSAASMRISGERSLSRMSHASVNERLSPVQRSGVPEELVEEVARKYAEVTASAGSAASMDRSSPQEIAISIIREAHTAASKMSADGRPRVLVQRVTDLERRLPLHEERLRDIEKPTADGREEGDGLLAAAGPANGIKAAPEGSLLKRVEMLEEAVDSLLVAQEAALLHQQQLLEAQELERKQAMEAAALAQSSGCCCCTIM